jgi:hypothetical protein
LELGIQSRNELVLEMAAKMGLDMMGEDDNKDEDDGGERDAAAPAATAAPAVATPTAATTEMVLVCTLQTEYPRIQA